MHYNSDKIEIMINEKADEFIKLSFESLYSRYEIGLEEPVKGSDFILDRVVLLYCKCHKR